MRRTSFSKTSGEALSRKIPHRLEGCDYVPVRNPDANDGLWVIGKRRPTVYARKDALTMGDGDGVAWKKLIPPPY
jgi:hypothetical protein